MIAFDLPCVSCPIKSVDLPIKWLSLEGRRKIAYSFGWKSVKSADSVATRLAWQSSFSHCILIHVGGFQPKKKSSSELNKMVVNESFCIVLEAHHERMNQSRRLLHSPIQTHRRTRDGVKLLKFSNNFVNFHVSKFRQTLSKSVKIKNFCQIIKFKKFSKLLLWPK